MITDFLNKNYIKEIVNLADKRYLIYYDFNDTKNMAVPIARENKNSEDK